MKIGIDCRLWNESGVGRYIRNLIEELAKIDRDNQYILFLRDKKQVEPVTLPENWQLRKVDIRWHTVEEQLRFPTILNKENLDLVHFPYFSVPIFYNRPFIVTIHDLILHHFPTGQASTLPLPLYKLKLLGYKFVISQAAKKAKKIITVSKSTKEEILDHLVGVRPEKIAVTYEGVDQQILNPKSQNTKYKILNTQYFLYVGNAYPHKNLERLLVAFSTLNSQLLTLKLVLVGKGDYFYRRLKEKVKKMGLSKLVVFLGEVGDTELAMLYQGAKALVLPSLMEGFGLSTLEAMSNGCLVLASDIPVLRETCGEATIYFNPYDVGDIAEKMKIVCFNDSGHFSRNIKNGFERTKLFSWKKMAEQTLEVYQSV